VIIAHRSLPYEASRDPRNKRPSENTGEKTKTSVDVAGGAGVSNAGIIGWSAIHETCLSFAVPEMDTPRVFDFFS